MSTFKSILSKVRRKAIRTYLNFNKYKLLSSEETIQLMTPHCIKVVPDSAVHLPEISDQSNPHELFYQAYTFRSGKVYVWQHELKNGFISEHGSVVINNKVLCTDWDHRGIEHEFWKKDKRPAKFVNTVIPLLSHHQDMSTYSSLTGYYDFVLLVAAKLSRVKDAIGDEPIRDMTITYHSFGGNYEKEYLELLGFNADNYVDSRTYKLSAEKVIFGNTGTWKPNVNEILSLKRNIEVGLNITKATPSADNRIYIARKGRRSVENEEELIALLQEFGFIIIEDKPRSVKEQIEIYRNASFIIGPHGASFSNVIWCKPQTFLYELFSASWKPDYFLYMCEINNMKYAAFQDHTREEITDNLLKALGQNIYISIPKLRSSLENILADHYSV